jgi:hypothetical protein
VLACALTGAWAAQAGGDWLDEAITHYAHEYKPRMQKYDERVRLKRSFNKNPHEARRFAEYTSWLPRMQSEYQNYVNKLGGDDAAMEDATILINAKVWEKITGFPEPQPFSRNYKYWANDRSLALMIPKYENVRYRIKNNMPVKLGRDRPTWSKFTAPFYNWYYRK